jgi:hypothetical protein
MAGLLAEIRIEHILTLRKLYLAFNSNLSRHPPL